MNCKFFTYLILALAFIAFTTCKKTKLKGDYDNLAGTWHWSRGWGDGGTKELKLDLKERGKYKLFRNKDKIDHGRLLKENGYLKFISEKIFNNKGLMLDTKQIVFISNDTINITKTDCADCAFTTFKKD
jgi:hypothetical protein